MALFLILPQPQQAGPHAECMTSDAAFKRVLVDQVDTVNVVTRLGLVGAVTGVGERQAKVLCRPRLHHMLQVNIAFPMLTTLALLVDINTASRRMYTINTATADVPTHQAQAGHTEGSEVEVVA